MSVDFYFCLEPPVRAGCESRVQEIRRARRDRELRSRPGCLGGLFGAPPPPPPVEASSEWWTLFVDPIHVLRGLVIGEDPFAGELLLRGYLPMLEELEQPLPVAAIEPFGRRPGDYSEAELGPLSGTRLGDLRDPSGDWPRVLAAACEHDAGDVCFYHDDGVIDFEALFPPDLGRAGSVLDYAAHIERVCVEGLREHPRLQDRSEDEILSVVWTRGVIEYSSEVPLNRARAILGIADWIRTWVRLGFGVELSSDHHDPHPWDVRESPSLAGRATPTGRWPDPLGHVSFEPLGSVDD